MYIDNPELRAQRFYTIFMEIWKISLQSKGNTCYKPFSLLYKFVPNHLAMFTYMMLWYTGPLCTSTTIWCLIVALTIVYINYHMVPNSSTDYCVHQVPYDA